VFSYPNLFPDTVAGRNWELLNWKELQAKHDRIPPAKRPNFEKLGVLAPFHYPWQKLITEWSRYESVRLNSTEPSSKETQPHVSSGSEGPCTKGPDGYSQDDLDGEFYVLRSRLVLRQFQKMLTQQTNKSQNGKSDGRCPQAKVSRKSKAMTSVHEQHVASCILEAPYDSQCLIPIRVSMIQRGHSEPFSMICLPTIEDIVKLNKDKSYSGPLEEIHKIKTLQKDKAKNKIKVKIPCPQTRELPKLKTILRSCSRHVIGFVKEGNFSYAKGSGFGLGFVASQALPELSKLDRPERYKDCVVLVRNSTSLQYRFAHLYISC
jgi:ribonuclease P/MRP protein subunit POP1